MRVFIDLSYGMRGVVDVTPAELDTFTKVLDRVRLCSYWYSEPEIKLDEVETTRYNIKVLPAAVKLVPYAEHAAPTTAEEN